MYGTGSVAVKIGVDVKVGVDVEEGVGDKVAEGVTVGIPGVNVGKGEAGINEVGVIPAAAV
jgi:hypothetical protein